MALSAGGTGYKFFKTDQSQLIRAGSADWPAGSSREAVRKLFHSGLSVSRRDLMSARLPLAPHARDSDRLDTNFLSKPNNALSAKQECDSQYYYD